MQNKNFKKRQNLDQFETTNKKQIVENEVEQQFDSVTSLPDDKGKINQRALLIQKKLAELNAKRREETKGKEEKKQKKIGFDIDPKSRFNYMGETFPDTLEGYQEVIYDEIMVSILFRDPFQAADLSQKGDQLASSEFAKKDAMAFLSYLIQKDNEAFKAQFSVRAFFFDGNLGAGIVLSFGKGMMQLTWYRNAMSLMYRPCKEHDGDLFTIRFESPLGQMFEMYVEKALKIKRL